MAFPKQLLADHEKVVFDIRPHWISVIPSALWTLVAIAAWVAGYRVADSIFDKPSTVDTAQNVVAIAAILLWIIQAVIPFLRWRFTMFVLTSDRLITRSGIVSKHSKEIPLERINDVAFSQTVLERVLGAGDLFIESAGERGQTRISDVRKPEQMQLMIYKESEDNSTRIVSGQYANLRSQDSPTPTTQLEELKALKDKGLITDIEYENKRQEIVKRL